MIVPCQMEKKKIKCGHFSDVAEFVAKTGNFRFLHLSINYKGQHTCFCLFNTLRDKNYAHKKGMRDRTIHSWNICRMPVICQTRDSTVSCRWMKRGVQRPSLDLVLLNLPCDIKGIADPCGSQLLIWSKSWKGCVQVIKFLSSNILWNQVRNIF